MSDSQRWLLLFAGLVCAVLLYLLAPVLTPFLISALLAYLGDPLVDKLEARRFPRSLAVAMVFLGILLVLLVIPLILIPLVEQQLRILLVKLPQYIDLLQQHGVPQLSQLLGIDPQSLDLNQLKQSIITDWRQAGGIAATLMASATQSGLVLLAWLANVVLVPVVTFYLLRDWDILLQHIRELVPRRLEADLVRLAVSTDEVLGAFLRGQLTVMLCLGTVYALGLWLVGLDFALLIGMIAGLVSFVPYLGFIVGIVLASLAAYLQFHEFMPLLGVVAVFGVGQALEGMLLTPLLVGDKIGLHPVAVIFAVLAGGQLFGFVGILLALPVAAVMMVLVRYAHEHYLRSGLYHRS